MVPMVCQSPAQTYFSQKDIIGPLYFSQKGIIDTS